MRNISRNFEFYSSKVTSIIRSVNIGSSKILGVALVVASFAFGRAGCGQTILYWDADGAATAATGGTGNWLATNTWRSGSPVGTLGSWVDGNRSYLSGTAGTVTLNGAVSATGVTFATAGYNVSGGSSLTLTSTSTSSGAQAFQTTGTSGTDTISANVILGTAASSNQRASVASGTTLLLSGNISEANTGITLSQSGSGTLTLAGANTYSGGTQVTAGTLALGSSSTVGSGGTIANGPVGAGTLTMLGNTILRSDGTTTRTLQNNVALSSSAMMGDSTNNGVLVFNSTGLTTASTISVSSTTLTLASDVTFANSLTGSRLSKTGAGTLTINGSNGSYSGGITLMSGTLQLGSSSALGTGSFNLNGGTVSATSTLNHTTVNQTSVGGNAAYSGSDMTFAGGLGVYASSGTPTRTLTFSNTVTFNCDNSNSTAGVGLEKAGSGTLGLAGATNWTGTTLVSAGTLQISTGNINGSSQVQVTGTGVLTLGNVNALSNSGTLSLSDGTTLNLNGIGTETINGLVLGNNPVQAGTYSASDLMGIDPNITFSGGELLQVLSTVPEPTTGFGGILLVGALGWHQRRRLGGLTKLMQIACTA